MGSPLKSKSGVMRARWQASLYYMRKKNRERREAAKPVPPDPDNNGN